MKQLNITLMLLAAGIFLCTPSGNARAQGTDLDKTLIGKWRINIEATKEYLKEIDREDEFDSSSADSLIGANTVGKVLLGLKMRLPLSRNCAMAESSAPSSTNLIAKVPSSFSDNSYFLPRVIGSGALGASTWKNHLLI